MRNSSSNSYEKAGSPDKVLHKILVFKNVYLQYVIGLFDFSSRTENCEKNIFEAVKAMMTKLPLAAGNQTDMMKWY